MWFVILIIALFVLVIYSYTRIKLVHSPDSLVYPLEDLVTPSKSLQHPLTSLVYPSQELVTPSKNLIFPLNVPLDNIYKIFPNTAILDSNSFSSVNASSGDQCLRICNRTQDCLTSTYTGGQYNLCSMYNQPDSQLSFATNQPQSITYSRK